MTFVVGAGDANDLLPATIDIPDAHPAANGTATGASLADKLLGSRGGPVTLALAFVLGMPTTTALRARGRWRAISGAAVLLVGLFTAGAALAHGGADDDDGPVPAVAFDTPRRLPDGGVAMPKDAQRLLAVRTVPAARTQSARTVQVIGQVIADPATAGRVQSTQSGRVQAVEGGELAPRLAHVSQVVQKAEARAMHRRARRRPAEPGPLMGALFNALVTASLKNRLFVMVAAVVLIGYGGWTLTRSIM